MSSFWKHLLCAYSSLSYPPFSLSLLQPLLIRLVLQMTVLPASAVVGGSRSWRRSSDPWPPTALLLQVVLVGVMQLVRSNRTLPRRLAPSTSNNSRYSFFILSR